MAVAEPSREKLPVPTLRSIPLPFVVSPIVVVRAPAVAMLTAAVSVSVAIFMAVPAVFKVAPASPVKRPVTSREPGVTMALASDHVIVLPDPVVVIWLDVPNRFMLEAEGEMAPPESPVNVAKVLEDGDGPKVHVAEGIPAVDTDKEERK